MIRMKSDCFACRDDPLPDIVWSERCQGRGAFVSVEEDMANLDLFNLGKRILCSVGFVVIGAKQGKVLWAGEYRETVGI